MKPIVGVLGMSHLGQVTAFALERSGFEVIRFGLPMDINESGLPPAPVVMHSVGALARCDIIYLALDVEAGEDRLPALLDFASPEINLRACLVVLSQVAPGFTRGLPGKIPPFERRYYQVDSLITGTAIDRALHPERFIIGCHDPKQPLHRSYDRLLAQFGCPILRMSYESAELAKIAINFMLASQIAAANALNAAALAVGAEWSDVERALRSDSRIGQEAYVRPSAIGGHLPRDVRRIGNMVNGVEFASPFCKGVEGYVEGD